MRRAPRTSPPFEPPCSPPPATSTVKVVPLRDARGPLSPRTSRESRESEGSSLRSDDSLVPIEEENPLDEESMQQLPEMCSLDELLAKKLQTEYMTSPDRILSDRRRRSRDDERARRRRSKYLSKTAESFCWPLALLAVGCLCGIVGFVGASLALGLVSVPPSVHSAVASACEPRSPPSPLVMNVNNSNASRTPAPTPTPSWLCSTLTKARADAL